MGVTTGDLIEISMGMGGATVSQWNVWQYAASSTLVTATAAEVGEAWWNHVKGTYRGLVISGWGPVFKTVKVRQMNAPTGYFGEYVVPIGEQPGTRTPAGSGDPLPFFNAVGVRLSVATRATRPGQKRFWCLEDADAIGGSLQPGIVAAVNAHMAVMCTSLLLGVPTAALQLEPIVCREDVVGNVTAHQDITGWVINSQVTSQVSRKPWRGL